MSKVPKRPTIVIPTVREDKVIAAAARADPDAQPLTRKQFKVMSPMRGLRCSPSRRPS